MFSAMTRSLSQIRNLHNNTHRTTGYLTAISVTPKEVLLPQLCYFAHCSAMMAMDKAAPIVRDVNLVGHQARPGDQKFTMLRTCDVRRDSRARARTSSPER